MLHKADVANEEHMRSPRIKGNIHIVPFLYCLSNEIGNFFLAVQDFRMGIPGMLIQWFGGYALLKAIAKK